MMCLSFRCSIISRSDRGFGRGSASGHWTHFLRCTQPERTECMSFIAVTLVSLDTYNFMGASTHTPSDSSSIRLIDNQAPEHVLRQSRFSEVK